MVQPVEPLLNLLPVVFVAPVPNQVTQYLIMGATAPTGVERHHRPAHGIQTPAQVIDLILGVGDEEWLHR